jgi:hypothetical protein
MPHARLRRSRRSTILRSAWRRAAEGPDGIADDIETLTGTLILAGRPEQVRPGRPLDVAALDHDGFQPTPRAEMAISAAAEVAMLNNALRRRPAINGSARLLLGSNRWNSSWRSGISSAQH